MLSKKDKLFMNFGGAAIVVKWCGMFLAIEPDGYTHS